jgi:outer membrane protein assembly factor BamB
VFDLANSGLVQHSPLVAPDGTIYVSFENFVFYALNRDGSVRWSRGLSGAPYTAPTIGMDGTIYINNFSNLIALNPAGNVIWSVPLSSSGGLGWPSIGADGVVYLDTANGLLLAFNPSNGSIQWQAVLPGSITSATPSIGADGTIYQIAGTSLFALTSGGAVLWSVNQNVGNASSITQGASLIGADGTIYTRNSNKVFAFNSDGTPKWVLDIPNSFSSDGSLVLANGAVYVNSSGLTMYK